MVIGGLVILGGLRGLTGSARTAGGFAWLSVVGCGCNEEGNLVVAPAASLRPSAEWKGLRPGEIMARLKPCPFDGLGWVRLVWQHGNPTRDQVLSRMGHPAGWRGASRGGRLQKWWGRGGQFGCFACGFTPALPPMRANGRSLGARFFGRVEGPAAR
jgi:hypothetical protein